MVVKRLGFCLHQVLRPPRWLFVVHSTEDDVGDYDPYEQAPHRGGSRVTYAGAGFIVGVRLSASDPNVSRLLNEKTATSERWGWD